MTQIKFLIAVIALIIVDQLSKYIWGKITADTKKILNEYNASGTFPKFITIELTDEINSILKEKPIWNELSLNGKRKKTKKLLKEKLINKKDIIYLNRLLLEEAYPLEISLIKLKRKPIKIFNIDIYVEYFSLVYGILFSIFIVILFLRLRLLKNLICVKCIQSRSNDDEINLYTSIKYFPWLCSPFHKSILGYIFFISVILLGFMELGFITYGHIFGSSIPNEAIMTTSMYRSIGHYDFFLFIFSIILFVYIIFYISAINKKLEER